LRANRSLTELLDGDTLRSSDFSRGIGFSKEEREAHLRRVGFLCKLLTRNKVIVIAAFVSPYQRIREEIRREVGNFREVYVKCPVDECMKRDTKGMYKKALAGQIENFTGVDDPYEPPTNPDLILRTHEDPIKDCVAKVLKLLAPVV
jgi:adenylyl-sulfate kinase